MTSTLQYVAQVKAKTGIASDYGIARILGVTRGAVSRWNRVPNATFEAPVAARVAALLGIDPLIVIADMEIARARSPEVRAVWESLAARVAAALVLGAGVACLVAVLGQDAPAAALLALNALNDCVLCQIEPFYKMRAYVLVSVLFCLSLCAEILKLQRFRRPAH